jgi:Tfp pilus assembly protein FimT
MTLPELLVALLALAATLLIGTLAAVPWMARESMRGTLHDSSVLLQLARMEAVSRNHSCSFRIDVGARSMSIVDMNDTSTTADDVVLSTRRMPTTVSVARPDAGAPITFENVGGTLFRVVFDRDGHVSTGAGEMVLYGGERYGRVTVYAAGGVRHESWNGATWVPGT